MEINLFVLQLLDGKFDSISKTSSSDAVTSDAVTSDAVTSDAVTSDAVTSDAVIEHVVTVDGMYYISLDYIPSML